MMRQGLMLRYPMRLGPDRELVGPALFGEWEEPGGVGVVGDEVEDSLEVGFGLGPAFKGQEDFAAGGQQFGSFRGGFECFFDESECFLVALFVAGADDGDGEVIDQGAVSRLLRLKGFFEAFEGILPAFFKCGHRADCAEECGSVTGLVENQLNPGVGEVCEAWGCMAECIEAMDQSEVLAWCCEGSGEQSGGDFGGEGFGDVPRGVGRCKLSGVVGKGVKFEQADGVESLASNIGVGDGIAALTGVGEESCLCEQLDGLSGFLRRIEGSELIREFGCDLFCFVVPVQLLECMCECKVVDDCAFRIFGEDLDDGFGLFLKEHDEGVAATLIGSFTVFRAPVFVQELKSFRIKACSECSVAFDSDDEEHGVFRGESEGLCEFWQDEVPEEQVSAADNQRDDCTAKFHFKLLQFGIGGAILLILRISRACAVLPRRNSSSASLRRV